MIEEELDIDLFAGPGGWDVAGRRLGMKRIVGIENDKAACLTRAANGHATIRADVAAIDPTYLRGRVRGLIGSPPCQDFSPAGKKAGLEGQRGRLVYEPLRWALALMPEWIALEQVKEVAPIWLDIASYLRENGYRVWTGIVDASEYGVPQQRKRAILMAHRDRTFDPPKRTHGDYSDSDDLFGEMLLPRITMGQALGWGKVHTVIDSRGDGGDGPHYRSAEFTTDRPARTLGEKARSWVVTPVPEVIPEWVHRRPATTVVGSFRPDIMAAPGWRVDPGVSRQNAPDSVPITVQQAGVLQSFPLDYKWEGSRTKQFEQVGNAIPPLLAEAILKQLL